jgi:pyrimidine-nucleoside phosphorylase
LDKHSEHVGGYPPQWIIERKRDGHALSSDEIRAFIAGYADGSIPDYQMAALAMAIYFRGMHIDEAVVLTDAMLHSGRVLDLSGLGRPTVDKHSTGGVGDKISLPLAPLVAACGAAVPMVSGRGLGITGGTLDKLESIPGYRTRLAVPEFLAVIRACGCSIVGQTDELAPVDRKLYALRDVTATVPSIPLITASIMSKKLAEGTGTLVLDVKWGRGAFMQTVAEARRLAETLVEVGRRMGRRMAALITDMNQPLGRAAGNTVEVVEAIQTLQGAGPADVTALTIALGAQMLVLTGLADSRAAAEILLQDRLTSGRALEVFADMIRLHGGDPRCIERPERLGRAPVRQPVPAKTSGIVVQVDADLIGRACVLLGAGRRRVEEQIDPRVGVTGLLKVGERVEVGQPLCVVHASDTGHAAQAERQLREACVIGDALLAPALPLIVEEVG